jgi:hypothetical protein
MKEYFYQTLSIITFLALVDLLISKSSNGRLVKAVISLISVIALAIPIVSIINNVDFSVSDDLITQNYNQYLLELEEKTYKEKVSKILANEELYPKDIIIEFSKDENSYKVEKIKLNFEKGVITSESEHINMTDRVELVLNSKINLSGVTVEIEKNY